MSKESKKNISVGKGANVRGGEKAKDFKGTMKKLFNHLKPYKLGIALVGIFAVLGTTFTIVGPKVLGKATNKIFEGIIAKINGTGGIELGDIGRILIILVALYLISTLFSFFQGFITSDIAQKVSYKLRYDISKKINKLPLSYFDSTTHGEVLSRVTNDVDTVSRNLNQVLTQAITSIISVLGILIMMLSISVTMTVVSIIVIPLSGILMGIIIKKSQKHFRKQQEYLGHVNGHVEEVYGGHIIMKAFNGEEDTIKKFDELNFILYEAGWKSEFLAGLMMPIIMFVGNIGYVLVAIAGGVLTIKNKIMVGDILSFIQYTRSFMQPITMIAQIGNVMQATAAAAERVFEFLEEKEELEEVSEVVDIENISGNVEFQNVKFGYNENKIIINDFSAKIKAGERIAIVGPTGAGKTTIVKLLMRFYEINEGSILIDNKETVSFKRDDLRNIFGMVLQDTWLFNGTILENIRYGNLTATDEEVKEAAKLAHAHHFIKTLEKGYNTEINEEGTNISQGQKQLITIARAILSNPKILILDEATSSVDTRTEVLIQSAMDNLMIGRTSFIIAHRLSTIRNADVILVMKDGDIVEQGNHEALLEKEGFYAELYNSQFS